MLPLILKTHDNRLEIDTDQPGVLTFAHDEKIVLVIDEAVSESVADITLDALITAMQRARYPKNPYLYWDSEKRTVFAGALLCSDVTTYDQIPI